MQAFDKLTRPHLKALKPYSPILPFEVLSEQLGIPTQDIIKLDANENPYGPVTQVNEALSSLDNVHIYPDPECRNLRAAISDYYNLPFENILAGAGADELIDLLIRVILDPGDAILDCPPTFGMYSFDAAIHNARVISIHRCPDFQIDLEKIEAAVIDNQPKILFLANPNNPDGNLIPDHALQKLIEMPIILVLDEAYIDFAPTGSSILTRIVENGSIPTNLVVLRTFSKWAGLAGLRIGFGLFPNWLMPYLWRIKQPYNVSVAASQAGVISLQNSSALDLKCKSILAERDRLMRELQVIPWLEPYPSYANFILCRVIGKDAGQLKAHLSQQGILIRHFNTPGLKDHVRISIGKPEHTSRLLVALKALE